MIAKMLPQCARPLRLILAAIVLMFAGCSSQPTDVRTVLPADALVYLESRDLGKALSAITENEKYAAAAASRPELSFLNGVRIGVAVTGFETSEQKVTEENSVLNFQPRFVAAVETRLWNFQAVSFTEEKLGSFINDVYGGEVLLESSEKHGGRYYVWTAGDGRKAYGLVVGSLILFGNDESALEKAIAIRRGEGESIAANPKLPGETKLAYGYVSPDGVAQIANLAGISLAQQAGEEAEVQSFIARVLPELLRNSVKEIEWAAERTDRGIEDRFEITLSQEIAGVFNEMIKPGQGSVEPFAPFLKSSEDSATRYNLADPRLAWRSILLTAQKQTDELAGNLIVSFADSLFEPYGVENAELFLSAVGTQIMTVRYDPENDKQVVITDVKDAEALKRSLAAELATARPPERFLDADLWRSAGGELALILVDGRAVLGDTSSVLRCIEDYRKGPGTEGSLASLAGSTAPAVTRGRDVETPANIVRTISEPRDPNRKFGQDYLTETRFSKKGIERRTVSDFGMIGSLIAALAPEQ